MNATFYHLIIQQLIKEGKIKHEHKILIVAGGEHDRIVMSDSGLTQVVISNLDQRMDASLYTPFEWSYQDGEALSYEDQTFDWVIEHNGLHHCHSPHRALLEMYRVARKGVVFFEPYDNFVTRLGVKLGFGQDFEHAAVFYNDMKFGGVRNSPIPNFIYRWSQADIIKTITCNEPRGPHGLTFIHKMVIPWGQLKGRKNQLPYLFVNLARPLFWLMEKILPSQTNCFAAVIEKPDLSRDVYPWLIPGTAGQPELNKEWLQRLYTPNR
jgi:ubiquinone/menaquinone biosynthesis C-methylase UbiE